MERVKVGVVGCGAISGAYLGMAPKLPILDIVACADINREAAEKKAKEFNIPRVCTVDEMMADPAIEIILNLTVPKAHVQIALQALEAGKHTYAEKPLAIDRADGRKILKLAGQKKLLVGCAPDTFMGAGVQTARKMVDDGQIGKPVAFTAFMMCPGHESWHPSPEFYYEVGGGPMYDMGPYYLTALLNLLGPVKRFGGMASIAIPERVITSQPKNGKRVTVETPDHLCGTIEFENGCLGTIITSFATRFATYDGNQPITLYGTTGTLKVPDPNGFDGPVSIMRNVPGAQWEQVPHAFPAGYGRAVGLADMACSVRNKRRPFRANGKQAYAVLDMMQGFLDSSTKGRALKPTIRYKRPDPMRVDLPFGTLA